MHIWKETLPLSNNDAVGQAPNVGVLLLHLLAKPRNVRERARAEWLMAGGLRRLRGHRLLGEGTVPRGSDVPLRQERAEAACADWSPEEGL